MNQNEYTVHFYRNATNGKLPVKEYIDALPEKQRAKVLKYIEFLRIHDGYLDEPYSKHITGKIRELRVDFGRTRHRIFYLTFVEKKIVLLHAFLKKTQKTPSQEIQRAQNNYDDFIMSYDKKI
jgi:phage-related protein